MSESRHKQALAVKLTEAQRRGLLTLESMERAGAGLIRTNAFGAEMWADRTCKNGYKGSNCSAPFALPAGKMLRRLQELEFVEWHVEMRGGEEYDWGWTPSAKGRLWLQAVKLTKEPSK